MKMHTRKIVLGIALSFPILLFCLRMLMTGRNLPTGDADYLIQTVEAARISILDHGQFPWWNPWISGGVPLFPNPQFGLLALPTILGLLFGAVIGYKLAIVAYFILGFYGLLLLFRKGLKTPLITAILLAYVWTFGTFLTYRVQGHYTFLTIQFLPYILYFYIARNRVRHSWLFFGLSAGLAALAAAHNMTILSYIVVAIFIIFDIVKIKLLGLKSKNKSVEVEIADVKNNLLFITKAGAVFLFITFYRLFFTLDYLNDFPRSQLDNPEPTIGIAKGLFAIGGPFRQFTNAPTHPQWSWMEASAYIGFTTCLAALVVGLIIWQNRKQKGWRKLFSYNPLKIIFAGLVFFLFGLGNFIGSLSPYSLLRHLPILSSMRVASRWFVFCSIMILIFIATYKEQRYRKVINILLFISVLELFLISEPQLAKPYIFSATKDSKASSFQQKSHYNTMRGGVPYDENLTDATFNNYGQIVAGDSLIDTRSGSPSQLKTSRCSVDEGCNFVMSNNAVVTKWTPNKIVLKRTGGGDIDINMNPGRDWMINNVYAFASLRIVEPGVDFKVKDPSDNIELRMLPRYSIEWMIWKVHH